MKISFGVIIAVILIVYWYMRDHPHMDPVKQGSLYTISTTV